MAHFFIREKKLSFFVEFPKMGRADLRDFKKGIELYQSKKFKNALKLFNKIFDINPNDYINFLYKSRCENLIKKTNLIKNWSPIVEYSEK